MILGLPLAVMSQDDDGLILGKTTKQGAAAVYDLSNPEGVNIEVNLWGFVQFPGRYIVPLKTTFIDLMTYAGGPLEESNLEEIRILRSPSKPGEKPILIKLNYNDLLWKDNLTGGPKSNPELASGDVILVRKEKRYSFREDVGFYLPIFTTLFSLATFIITVTKK
jgi:hypothetical protein